MLRPDASGDDSKVAILPCNASKATMLALGAGGVRP